jgi:hypothetical protein
MTSEAKIGLLVGLAIIFVIAFVLNEPPRFGNAIDNGSIYGFEFDRTPGIGHVGQTLVIGRLISSESDEATIGSIFPGPMFERVKSIGTRRLETDNRPPSQGRQYVVRQGDNLWSVAAAQLGDATRYKEISRLNAGILKDEHTLSIGMRLNLPAHFCSTVDRVRFDRYQ